MTDHTKNPIHDLEDQLALDGFKVGSEAYDKEFRGRKLLLCLERRGLRECSDCPAVLDCSLRLSVRRDRG